jgi:hypothetical protein
LKLEDDDRRLFEATLPPNTIAFVTGQMLVSEADPAVQVDVVRFKPGNEAAQVSAIRSHSYPVGTGQRARIRRSIHARTTDRLQ